MIDNNKDRVVVEMLDGVSEKVRSNIATVISLFNKIKWKKVFITIPMVPKPAARPRLSGYRVYVPGAHKNGAFFNREVLPTLGDLFIDTPCRVKLDIFVQTPQSFTQTQKCLAEMRVLRPWTHTGDVDNFEKSVYDMIQPNEKRGHTGILYDDSLIIEALTNKYYSKNPRYELTISYMNQIPESILNILRLNK